MKKSLIQKFGLLGVISFLSYTAAVIFSPPAYPGYNRLAQAVSDLSAANAPSLALWNRMTALQRMRNALHNGRLHRAARQKNKVDARRSVPFRRDGSGFRNRFSSVPVKRQRIRGNVSGRNAHMITTAIVVLLSIGSLAVIIAAGIKSKSCRSYGICAAIALGMMLVGALGMKIVPAAYFGVVERFSVFAATGFNAALEIHLFCDKDFDEKLSKQDENDANQDKISNN